MKRKLEDVLKKLDILYDKLREQTVSILFSFKIIYIFICVEKLKQITCKMSSFSYQSFHNFSLKSKLLFSEQLSPNVLVGLHQIVQAVQAYNYNLGLDYHKQMVSQGNFSEISSFMPGVKVLLQMGSRLQVFVQREQQQ